MITKALIENFRETVKPFVSKMLFGINYENMGTLDCVEFERDFDEILDLALAGYEQKVNNAVSTLDGNKNDMVYRQQAIDAVDAIGHIATMPDGVKCIRKNAVKYTLSMLPPAQPEPNEGHWINGKCDRCGGHAPFWAMASTYYNSKYCPHCGAKMTTQTK